MTTLKVRATDANGKPYIITINDADAEWVATGATTAAATDVSDYDGV